MGHLYWTGFACGFSDQLQSSWVYLFCSHCRVFLRSSKIKNINLSVFGRGCFSFLALVTPFMVGNVSVEHYLEWIQMASKHGLIFKDFVKHFTFHCEVS